jgi:hypothetical protein
MILCNPARMENRKHNTKYKMESALKDIRRPVHDCRIKLQKLKYRKELTRTLSSLAYASSQPLNSIVA